MIKIFASFLFLLSFSTLACPYCAGNTDSPDKNSFIILAIAIILIYIPFYMLFRMAIKRKKSNMDDSLKEGL